MNSDSEINPRRLVVAAQLMESMSTEPLTGLKWFPPGNSEIGAPDHLCERSVVYTGDEQHSMNI